MAQEQIKMVVDFDGEEQPASECIQFTRGDYEGEWVRRDHPNLVHLHNGEYCHQYDNYHYYPRCRTYVHEDDAEDLDLVLLHDSDEYEKEDECVLAYVDRWTRGWVYFDAATEVRELYGDLIYVANFALNRLGYNYCDREDEWRHEDDECWNVAEYNAGYDDLKRLNKSSGEGWAFGVEVEKEDSSAVSIPYQQLYDRTGWCKERDGSLDEDYGFELVSPRYDLMSDALFEAIEDDSDLLALVNADYGYSCGGHMSISHRSLTGSEVFDHLEGWMPLLYALYPDRAERSYSLARPASVMRWGSDSKGSSVYVSDPYHTGYRVEIRLFPAVKNLRDLKWRTGLLRLMTAEKLPLAEVLWRALSPLEVLHHHLRAAGHNPEALVREAIDWYERIEGISSPIKYADIPLPLFAPNNMARL